MKLAPALLLAIAGLLLLPVASSHAADDAASFVVKGFEFDRGNVTVYDHGTTWADGEAILLNAGVLPNTAEYDIDFPVTADYAIWANYAAAAARPVDFFLDGEPLVRGLNGETGSFNSSTAKWEKQTTTPIKAGKHTFKFVCPGPCIPHIVAFRFESSKPFPPGWKRVPHPMHETLPGWSGRPEAGKTKTRTKTKTKKGPDRGSRFVGRGFSPATTCRPPGVSQPCDSVAFRVRLPSPR